MADFHDKVNVLLGVATKVFGEDVVYTPKSTGTGLNLRAVFDANSFQLDPNTNAVVATQQPMIGVRLKDLPDIPRKGDNVLRTYLGKQYQYRVIDSQEDGQGGASLMLQLTCDNDNLAC